MSPDAPMSRLKIWWLAARPKTLTAATVPIAVGTALAWSHGRMQPLAALMALLGALWIQVGTNFANDLFDFKKGTDNETRLGPMRVTSAGLVSPRQVAWATGISFALAFLCGTYLIWVAGWPLLVLGLVSIFCGIIYTGGPFPLAYNALGDVFVFVFFGLVATVGTYYVQALQTHSLAYYYGASVGALGVAILIVNNLRDILGDEANRKITTAVIMGPAATRVFYVTMLVVAYALPIVAVIMGWSSAWVLLSLGSLPLAASLVRDVYTREGAALNPILGKTAKLQLLTGMLLALGVAL